MCSARWMPPTRAISFAELSGWFGGVGGCGGPSSRIVWRRRSAAKGHPLRQTHPAYAQAPPDSRSVLECGGRDARAALASATPLWPERGMWEDEGRGNWARGFGGGLGTAESPGVTERCRRGRLAPCPSATAFASRLRSRDAGAILGGLFLPKIVPSWNPCAFLPSEMGPERNPEAFLAAAMHPAPAPPGCVTSEITPDSAPGAFPARPGGAFPATGASLFQGNWVSANA